MNTTTWSKDAITTALIDLYRTHGPDALRSTYIGEHRRDIHNAVYYRKPDGSPAYFSSLKAARRTAARRLLAQGHVDDALRIRALNKQPPSPNKRTQNELEQLRNDVRERFQAKLGEDLSYRHQQKVDRPFVTACITAFGEYKEVFADQSVDYTARSRVTRKGRDTYLDELTDIVRGSEPLDRESVAQQHPKLVSRLTHYFDGYYNALQSVADALQEAGEKKLARRAEPRQWQTERAHDGVLARITRRPDAREAIIDIHRDGCYTNTMLPLSRGSQGDSDTSQTAQTAKSTPTIENVRHDATYGEIPTAADSVSGRDAIALLKSVGWCTTTQLAQTLSCTASNVVKNIIPNHPTQTVRYHEGERVSYLFHPAVQTLYERRHRSIVQPDSRTAVANAIGAGYSKIRNLSANLELGKKHHGAHHLRKEDIRVITSVVQRERTLITRMLQSIDVNERYSVHELEVMGVPAEPFRDAVREGRLPVQLRDKARVVDGSAVAAYVRDKYNPSFLNQGLRLIAHFHPHLHDTTTLIERTGIERKELSRKLRTVLNEQPGSCYKLVRDNGRSRIVATDNVLVALKNWKARGAYHLTQVIDNQARKSTRGRISEALSDIACIEGRDGMVPFSRIDNAFTLLQEVRAYAQRPVAVDDTPIGGRDLTMLVQYMRRRKYTGLALDRIIDITHLEALMAASPRIAQATAAIERTEELLFHSNAYLIDAFQPNIFFETYEHLASTMLADAIRTFRPGNGIGFTAYAGYYIDLVARSVTLGNEQSAKGEKQQTIPLHAKAPDMYAERVDFAQKVSAALEVKLTPRELEVILARFGIGGDQMTREDIGERRNVTRERIRQIEEKALKKLAKSGELAKLALLVEK